MHQRSTSWIFLCTAGLFFLLAWGQATNLYQRSKEAQHLIEHTADVQRSVQAVKGSIRGYETYSNIEQKLGRYSLFSAERQSVAAATQRHLNEFRTLTQDNRVQQVRAQQLQQMLKERYESGASSGPALGERITATLQRMEETEDALLKQRQETYAKSSRTRYYFTSLGFLLLSLLWVATAVRSFQLTRRRANAEEQAHLAEARYRLLLEDSDLTLWVLDKEGIVTFIGNAPQVEKVLGFNQNELLGRTTTLPLPQSPVPEGDRKTYEHQMDSASGGKRWMAYRTHTVTDGKGGIKEYQIVAWDIDAEKRIQLELEELTAQRDVERHLMHDILNQIPNIVYVKDLQGRFVMVNSKTCELLEASEQELLGRTTMEVHRKSIDSRLAELDEVVRKEQRVVVSEETYLKGSELRFYYMVKFPIFDSEGTLQYTGGVSTDITELKNKERALTEATLEAEEARAGQETFLAAISHELRTPLNGVMGMVNLLAGTPLNDEQRDYTDTILASARNLLALINDLLDFSKIKAGKFTFERQGFRVRHTVRKALYPLQFKAEEKGIQLNIRFEDSLPETLVGDALRLSQILINLVGNAVKFTAKGSVDLTISGQPLGDVVVLNAAVRDTGIGIPTDKLDFVFESFAQNTSGMSRNYGGTGLGLAIVKQLVELQGGSIKVESLPGEGSTFTVTMPFEVGTATTAVPADGPTDVESDSGQSLQGLSILVAEDNLINQKVARTTLQKQGAEVHVVENGRLAVEALAEGEYDLVLLDLQMPEMDGFAAARAIRKRYGKRIPLIAMTADALKGEAERCMQAGMTGFIAKPFEPADLYKQILDAIRGGHHMTPEAHVPLSTPAPLQEGPQIDLSYVEELSGGDDAYISELLGIFLSSTGPGVEHLTELVREGTDLKAINRQAHQLKSSVGVVRLPGVLSALQKLEAAAKYGNFSVEDMLPVVESISTTLQAAMPRLQALRDKGKEE
jgi:PAS domain S-box-containing protein